MNNVPVCGGIRHRGRREAFNCYRRDQEQMSNEMTDSPFRDMRCNVCMLSSAAFTSQNTAKKQLLDMFLIVASSSSCTSASETAWLLSSMSNNLEAFFLQHKEICMCRHRICCLQEFKVKHRCTN